MKFNLCDHTILLALSGSRSYGMHDAFSDVDIKGVCIPPKNYFFGAMDRFEQIDHPHSLQVFVPYLNPELKKAAERHKLEGTVYHLHKFVRLAMDANPNILDVLYCRERDILHQTKLGSELRSHRDLFLSTKVKHTFAGYALAQLKRIKGHRKWLLHPPKQAPDRADFGLLSNPASKHQISLIQDAIQKKLDSWDWDFGTMHHSEILRIKEAITQTMTEMKVLGDEKWVLAARGLGASEDVIEHIRNEKRYVTARRQWKQYENWRRNRNPERAKIEEKYGYDLKHAAHLVRLLTMGREILTTGQVHVWRGDIDAKFLVAIRSGLWSYGQLIEWAEHEKSKLDDLYAQQKSTLPPQPDRKAIDELTQRLVEQAVL